MAYFTTTPARADRLITEVFDASGDQSCLIDVMEDKCFNGKYLEMGSIVLKPEPARLIDDRSGAVLDAVRGGSFEWEIPSADTIKKEITQLLGIDDYGSSAGRNKNLSLKISDRISDALNATACIGTRLGLIHPHFDARGVEEMPFRRATTVVTDTSGVVQGAFDFVIRFCPTARIKIPAVVHMEIVNQADRFLRIRRASRRDRSTALVDHILSQGGQGALLRLELRQDTEIERTAVFGDPLRNAFRRDTDQDFADLNLSVPLRSYCDRLVVETARQHQSYASPGHPVFILTSDQGLARMALAEGIKPLFFRAVTASDFFGHLLTGTGFHPFSGMLHRVPLTSVLWELATTFGAARITTADGNRSVEVAAVGEDITWAPSHSYGNLLWTQIDSFERAPARRGKRERSDQPPALHRASGRAEPSVQRRADDRSAVRQPAPIAQPTAGAGFYRFNVASMLGLIWELDEKVRLPETSIPNVIGTTNSKSLSEYRKFLDSGNLIRINQGVWESSNYLHRLATSLRLLQFSEILSGFAQVPSFSAFINLLNKEEKLSTDASLEISRRAFPTYQTLAEISCVGAPIPMEGFYPTPVDPPPSEFASIALLRFRELARGETLVSVGAWLESLVRNDHIHPVNVRRRLEETVAMGAIRRVTEGSTTDTRHDQHALRVLAIEGGRPTIRVVYLYRGDFLIPNKSSVSLRLEDVS
jgi:hypothetical protein